MAVVSAPQEAPSMSPRDPAFEDKLRLSHMAVVLTADWLRAQGYKVQAPQPVAGPYSQREQHADSGDLYVLSLGIWQRLEVKHLSADFDTATGWPWPRVKVCSKQAFDRAQPRPLAFIYLNRLLDQACILPVSSYPRWSTMLQGDASKGIMYRQWIYVAPKDACTIVSLDGGAPTETAILAIIGK